MPEPNYSLTCLCPNIIFTEESFLAKFNLHPKILFIDETVKIVIKFCHLSKTKQGTSKCKENKLN